MIGRLVYRRHPLATPIARITYGLTGAFRLRDRFRWRVSVPARGVRGDELRPSLCRPRGRSRSAAAGGRSHGRVAVREVARSADGLERIYPQSFFLGHVANAARTAHGAKQPSRPHSGTTAIQNRPSMGLDGRRRSPWGSSRTARASSRKRPCPRVAAIRRRKRSFSRPSRPGSASGRGSSPPPRPDAARPGRWRSSQPPRRGTAARSTARSVPPPSTRTAARDAR